jgi:hypothetical protein
VIRGSFIRAGQVDWAALCSRELTSVILIFRNGNPGAIVELARRPDANFLQGIGANQLGFSRAISVATAGFIPAVCTDILHFPARVLVIQA